MTSCVWGWVWGGGVSLFDLCDLHVSFQAHASPVDISRHENRAQIQAVTILHPLSACLILFFALVGQKGTTQTHWSTQTENIIHARFNSASAIISKNIGHILAINTFTAADTDHKSHPSFEHLPVKCWRDEEANTVTFAQLYCIFSSSFDKIQRANDFPADFIVSHFLILSSSLFLLARAPRPSNQNQINSTFYTDSLL